MKGSNSRLSHRPAQRYSNLAHVQGGMVTDADLTEAGQLHQARDETLGTLTVPSGVPAEGGMVALIDGKPVLRGGLVIAEGKTGRFAVAGETEGASLAEIVNAQADLPEGPDLPERAFLYADLWERPVVALQDPYLSDPGLHGAETSYRTRTMVQVKALPLDAVGEDALAAVLADIATPETHSPFVRIGTARASVDTKETEIALDDCDPCATTVTAEQQVPNALFRLEVVAVERAGDGSPRRLRLAWSHENASAVESVAALDSPDVQDAFARDGMVYGFFSEVTNAQVGWVPPGFGPSLPEFTETPAPPSGGAFTHARRWDGAAWIDLDTGNVTEDVGTGVLSEVAADQFQLSLETFNLVVDHADASILAGDYWLVELRRFADADDRIRLVGADDAGLAGPAGIRHHIVPLFAIDGGDPVELDDATRRRLSFPGLADLPASHVSYDPACPGLYHGAQNVQEALDALCDRDATEIRYDPSDGCERFAGVTTVHGALERLCAVEDTVNIERILRHIMDWGVVCGVRVALLQQDEPVISITAGTILDHAGRLIDVPAQTVELNGLPEENTPVPFREMLEREDEFCLALAAEPGPEPRIGVHIVPRRLAFGPSDRTFEQAVTACIEGKAKVNFGDKWRQLDDSGRRVAEDMVAVWKNRETLFGTVPMSNEDRNTAQAFNKTLLDDFAEKATEEEVRRVNILWERAEAEYAPRNATGATRNRRLMQLEVAKLGILANADEDRQRRCECENALPPCPPKPGEPPLYVPIACLEGIDTAGENEFSFVERACEFCCRKQAVTWRSYLYYNRNPITSLEFSDNDGDRWERFKKLCCTQRSAEPPQGGLGEWLDEWDGELFPPIKPEPIPDPFPPDIPRWPLKQPPYDVLPDDIVKPGRPGGGFTDPVPGFKNKVDIVDLTLDNAEDALTGNGFDVVTQIDVDETEDPLGAVREAAGGGKLLTEVLPEPGDKVAMMVQNGRATGYVLVEKGSGKAPYVPKSERLQTEDQIEQVVIKLRDQGALSTDGRVGGAIKLPNRAELETFEAQLKGLTELQSEAKASLSRTEDDLGRIRSEREALTAELEGLRNDVDALSDTRASLSQEIAAARNGLDQAISDRASLSAEVNALSAQLQELRTLREGTAASVAETRTQLVELQGLKDSLSRDIDTARTEIERVQKEATRQPAGFAPVEMVATNPRTVDALRQAGIGTVGALANLTPEQERDLIRSERISRAELGELVERSKRQLER